MLDVPGSEPKLRSAEMLVRYPGNSKDPRRGASQNSPQGPILLRDVGPYFRGVRVGLATSLGLNPRSHGGTFRNTEPNSGYLRGCFESKPGASSALELALQRYRFGKALDTRPPITVYRGMRP